MGIVIHKLAFHSPRQGRDMQFILYLHTQPLFFVLNLPFPESETWTVEEVINAITLNATQDGKTRQLQLCGIAIRLWRTRERTPPVMNNRL
ncbi:MAG: hypothetical protein WBA13_09805 [Microcoleaceae cyanobacterium]